jgi:acyl-CoA reductase-like NAD-dependent aldehyde dehydrogenase
VGQLILEDERIDLVSFTGSTAIGRKAATTVGARFGRTVLELGGNNAVLVMDDADEQAALTSVLFAAVGTCGQVCCCWLLSCYCFWRWLI